MQRLDALMLRIWVCLVAVLLGAPVAPAESVADETLQPSQSERCRQSFLARFGGDTLHLVTAPARWDSPEWLTLAAVSGMTLGLTVVDEDIQKWVQKDRVDRWEPGWDGGVREDVFTWSKRLGDGDIALVTVLGTYLYGRWSKDSRAKETAVIAFESLVLTTVTVEVVKRAVDRKRPSGWGISHDWGPDANADPGKSFPSGHTAAAFSIATVAALQYEEHAWVAPVFYGLATLTALSRVNENRHWTSDVFAGACIGHFVSRSLVKRGHKEHRVEVVPVISARNSALRVHLRF